MRRVGLIIAVVTTAFPDGAAFAVDAAAVMSKNGPAVVTLFAEREGDGETIQGSGCCVDASGLVLTVAHALRGATRVRVRTAGGQEETGEVVELDETRDLALVRAGEAVSAAAAVGDASALRSGSPVVAISAPRGLHSTVALGIVANADRVRDGRPVLQTDLDLAEGASGGPVFDERGDLVGVVAARIDAVDEATLVTPINEAYGLLRKHGVALPEPNRVEKSGYATLNPRPDGNANRQQAVAAYNYGVITKDREHKIAAYETAVRFDPDFFEAWFNLGVAYTAAGRDDDALEAYARAEQLQPDSAAPLRNRGRLLLRMNRLEEVAEVFERAAERAPEDPGVHNDLGEAYRRLGRLDRARDRFEKAVALRPEYAPPRYNLGLTYAALEMWKEAAESFEAYLRLEPDAPDAEQVRSRIADLRRRVE